MKSTGNSEGSRLQITTSADRTHSSAEIQGSSEEHLYNLMLLTRDVCKILNIPPFIMAGILVQYIARYEKSGNVGDVMMDLSAMKKGRDSTR